MGYYSRFIGEITIDPPLPWKLIKDTPWIEDLSDLCIKIDECQVEVDDGYLTSKEGIAIVPATEDSYKGYYALDTLQVIVNTFPDRTFTGEIRREGEESPDLGRLLVIDGKAVEYKPELVWPDGKVEKAR